MSIYYVPLRNVQDAAMRRRTAERLRVLRKSLEPVRARKSDSRLLLATWNIRDFDSNKFKHGPRLEESFFYIAEVISSFDLVAVQEVNRDLRALRRVMKILGWEWDYIVTDTTAGAGGNDERMAFIFNKEKVSFRKIAGEIVLPEGQTIVGAKKKRKDAANQEVSATTGVQFSRTPFLVAFQSGWFKFSLCTVHIYYGKASGPALQQRIAEIAALTKFFADSQDKDSQQERDESGNVENYILLGDFNVVHPEHETMKALAAHEFKVPAQISGDAVRKEGQHYYDQIAVRVKDPRFGVVGGGLYDLYAELFRDNDEDFAIYSALPQFPKKDPEAGAMREDDPRKYFRKWRTWQMSDHYPLWVEIDTDYTDDYLQRIAALP